MNRNQWWKLSGLQVFLYSCARKNEHYCMRKRRHKLTYSSYFWGSATASFSINVVRNYDAGQHFRLKIRMKVTLQPLNTSIGKAWCRRAAKTSIKPSIGSCISPPNSELPPATLSSLDNVIEEYRFLDLSRRMYVAVINTKFQIGIPRLWWSKY